MSTDDMPTDLKDLTDWFTLTAYFAGTCTADERATVDAWLAADPARQQRLTQLRAIWDARQHRPRLDYDRDTAIARVLSMAQETSATSAAHVSRMTGQHGSSRTLPHIVRALVDALASRVGAALFGPREAALTAAEVKRLRALIARAQRDDA